MGNLEMTGRQEPRPAARIEIVDSLLAIWAAAYVALSNRTAHPPVFPGTYALLMLFTILYVRRATFPLAKRPIQFTEVALLAIASAFVFILTPLTNHSFKAWAAAALLIWSCQSQREVIAGAFGLSAGAAFEVRKLRPVFLVTGIAAALTGVSSAVLLQLRPDSAAVVLSLWLIPFGLNWLSMRYLRPSVVLDCLEDAEMWHRIYGPPWIVLGVIAAISMAGFGFEFLLPRHNYLAWSVITGMLLLQGLVFLQIQRWASAKLSSAGRPCSQ